MRKATYTQPHKELRDYPEAMMVTEVCAYLRITKPTVMKMITDGRISADKYGKQWRIPRSQFEN